MITPHRLMRGKFSLVLYFSTLYCAVLEKLGPPQSDHHLFQINFSADSLASSLFPFTFTETTASYERKLEWGNRKEKEVEPRLVRQAAGSFFQFIRAVFRLSSRIINLLVYQKISFF